MFRHLQSTAAVLAMLGFNACYASDPAEVDPQPPAAGANSTRLLGEFAMSDADRQASSPVVRFIDGHWRVAWHSSGPEDGPRLELATIRAGGEDVVRRSGPMLFDLWPSMKFDARGRLGLLYDADGCVLQIYERDLQPAGPPFHLPCTRDDHIAAAAPLADGSEWTLAFGGPTGDFAIGRYRPSSAAWVAPPTLLGPRGADGPLDLFASEAQVIAAWGSGSGTAVHGFDPQQDGTASDARLRRAALSDGGYGMAELEGNTLLMASDSAGLWTAAIDRTGAVVESQLGRAVVNDRKPGLAVAAELGLVGACYGVSSSGRPDAGGGGSHDRVAFLLLNAQGQAVESPRMIGEPMPNFGGCDIAWSGEEFLVVYWHIDLSHPNSIVSRVMGQYVYVDSSSPQ